MHFQLSNSQDR